MNEATNPAFTTYRTQAEYTADGDGGTRRFGIVKDAYKGQWTVSSNKRRSDVFTAEELTRMAGRDENGFIIIWKFFGHVNGVKCYGRERGVARKDGSIAAYDSNGALSIVHPADRKIRILTR
jgi:hypothetical protein